MLIAIAFYLFLSIVGASLVLLSVTNLWLKIKFDIKDRNYTEIGGEQNANNN